jgi:hypothetical protein
MSVILFQNLDFKDLSGGKRRSIHRRGNKSKFFGTNLSTSPPDDRDPGFAFILLNQLETEDQERAAFWVEAVNQDMYETWISNCERVKNQTLEPSLKPSPIR